MITLQHPHIPGLRIERDGDVEAYLAAGWQRVDDGAAELDEHTEQPVAVDEDVEQTTEYE